MRTKIKSFKNLESFSTPHFKTSQNILRLQPVGFSVTVSSREIDSPLETIPCLRDIEINIKIGLWFLIDEVYLFKLLRHL